MLYTHYIYSASIAQSYIAILVMRKLYNPIGVITMLKVIKLSDGLEVEVETSNNQAHEISDKDLVDASIDNIQEMLIKVMTPVSNTYKELSKDMQIDSAKVVIGVKIGVEGNFILAKSSAGANIQVEMTFRPLDA